MSPPPVSRLPDRLLQDFDTELQEFYNRVIRREYTQFETKRYAECIKQATREIVLAYKIENATSSSSAFRFDTGNKRCAYVLKHSPCFTSAVASHFMNLVTREDVLHGALQRGELNVCCLGGGPASEVVAIAKILGPLYHPYWMNNPRQLNLGVTVVDINEDWEETCRTVLDNLVFNDKFEGIDKISFSFHFIQADLSKAMEDRLKAVIRDADVLTMVYFVSAVNGGDDREDSFNMVENIMKLMKTGAVLFFLDSAKDVHYKQMERAAKVLGNLKVVYGPCVEHLHCLSIESVKKYLDIYKDLFNRYLCMTNSFMSYCVWCKSGKVIDTNDTGEEDKLGKISTGKNDARLTEKMVRYRREVEELLDTEFGLKHVDNLVNWREMGLSKQEKPENWREIDVEKIKKSENRGEFGLKKLNKRENWREMDETKIKRV